MASYNNLGLPICVGSRVNIKDGIEIDRASNGAARGRSIYTSDKREFTLKHGGIDAEDRAALDAFYSANKTAEFDLTFDGVTYSCQFASAPKPEYIGANLADVTVDLVEI